MTEKSIFSFLIRITEGRAILPLVTGRAALFEELMQQRKRKKKKTQSA
jgi:hypothetical protein